MSGSGSEQAEYYRGVEMASYDLVKELAIALVAVLAGVLVLAAVFSSPDVPPLTLRTWATRAPIDFLATSVAELQHQSESAQYGPPYNHGTGQVQTLGPLAPQLWAGIHQPVNPAEDFVLQPLRDAAAGRPALLAALARYRVAPPLLKQRWLRAYRIALSQAHVRGGVPVLRPGGYGPVPAMMDALLGIGRTGGLDGLLLSSGHFYQTDYTQALLFMGDGGYIYHLAAQQDLLSTQWGMMNETGNYPGQTWLWLYTMWYQIPPYNTAHNADLLVVLTMLVLTSLLAVVPFIPGLRDLPRWLPVQRLIWRRYYRSVGR